MSNDAVDAIGIKEILSYIPHRYPFLMVDRVININSDESGIGIKNVTFNEPYFMGHFPGNPVMPGVMLIEGMAQTAGVLCAHAKTGPKDRTVYFLTIDKAKFRRPVVPGDVVEFHVTKLSRRRNMWWYRGLAKVGGQIAAEAEVGAMIAGELRAAD
jgi:3-hydroxyacyl-[acyl-carrier-protein] dehydratase